MQRCMNRRTIRSFQLMAHPTTEIDSSFFLLHLATWPCLRYKFLLLPSFWLQIFSLAQAMWLMTQNLFNVLIRCFRHSWSPCSFGLLRVWVAGYNSLDLVPQPLYMESGKCLVDGPVCFICSRPPPWVSLQDWIRSGNEPPYGTWTVLWRGLEAGQFPMFGHTGLGDIRFEWLYL